MRRAHLRVRTSLLPHRPALMPKGHPQGRKEGESGNKGGGFHAAHEMLYVVLLAGNQRQRVCAKPGLQGPVTCGPAGGAWSSRDSGVSLGWAVVIERFLARGQAQRIETRAHIPPVRGCKPSPSSCSAGRLCKRCLFSWFFLLSSQRSHF